MDRLIKPKQTPRVNLDICLDRCIFLGQGRCGAVYLMPDGRALKIFKNPESCVREYLILESVKGNKHFPIAYECRDNCLIRDFVDGICLEDYVRRYGLSPHLAENLIELIQDFKRLGFTRLDMRCSHIFVQDDESVMVIDPRDHYTANVPYPRKMLSRLRELKAGKIFFKTLKDKYPSLYNEWKRMRSI